MIDTVHIESEVAIYFATNPSKRKYDSPLNRQIITDRVSSYGIIPSETAVFRAIQELANEGAIERADGGDEHTDKLGAAIAERKRIDRLASGPLTDADFTKYSSMSPADVEYLFHSDALFQARYRKACEKWGFKLPGKPAPSADIPVESDQSQWRTLDAKTYHSLPTTQIIRLYQSDQGFKRAVDRLIKNGLIVLFLIAGFCGVAQCTRL